MLYVKSFTGIIFLRFQTKISGPVILYGPGIKKAYSEAV